MKRAIVTEKAPTPLARYSQAILAGGFLFVSGQVSVDPATGTLVGEDIKAQTRRVLENISAILEAAGATLDNVVKVSVYLADSSLYKEFNEVYGEYFDKVPPARTTVATALPGKGFLIEMDVIAYIG
jgi:2-iminobutanoate/2-iminopropanoate deaminase